MNTAFSIEDVANATIDQIQLWFDQDQLTSARLVLLYLERIARFDRTGPKLNSVIEVNPDAYHIALSLDQERRLHGVRGPLHGIPVLIKDNIATADKMHTSAGSFALKDVYAPEDATIVTRLRQAGAIILGKTNLTEWANFMTHHMPNGFSSRGGQVLNPYGPGAFDTGGSSSGSGAAIAAGLAAFVVGTETSGSILSPSSQQSLVGIKPTVGRLSRFGIIPISHSQDTAGPMARTVKDAALALGVMTGFDSRDAATGQINNLTVVDYTEGLDENALQDTRIGVPGKQFVDALHPWQQHILTRALKELETLGATLINPVELPELDKDYTVLTYEFKTSLNAYLAWLGHRSPVASLKDVIAYNAAHPETCLQYGQTLMTAAEATSGTLTESEYLAARLRDLRLSMDEGIDAIMSEHHLDALVFVANLGAGIAAKAGYPSITVPSGYSPEGEPLGLTFTARAWEEPKLIQLAYAYEAATQHRRPPQLNDTSQNKP